MSAPTELSFDEILKFMLAHNGKVTNYELVKHFKVFLMNPDMRDEARNTFKKHVNALAIIKNQNNEKWLILKKKYMVDNGKENESTDNKLVEPPVAPESIEPETSVSQPPYKPPPPLQLNQDFNVLNNIIQEFTPVALPVTNLGISQNDSQENLVLGDDIPPKVHPRRKSSEKNVFEKRSSIPNYNLGPRTSIPNNTVELVESSTLTSSRSESMLVETEQKISVKERKQMFNRMASESDVLKSQKLSLNTSSVDEEDRASLEQKETDPLDPKQKQWILCAAKGEYHTLAKMCKENSKLVRTKDPFTTAMHWACKRGDENLVKLLAGIHRNIVNERSYCIFPSGLYVVLCHCWDSDPAMYYPTYWDYYGLGYTPLHIAMQYRHENVYRLLVEVYDADPNVRDWSGKKPRQYLVHIDTSLSPGSYRTLNKYIRRTATIPRSVMPLRRLVPVETQANEKEGFLRIGSLNVRVKKTTEAFSNFLGVGATRSSAYVPKLRDRELDRRSDDGDQLHKSWGSADNIQQKDDKIMPPPSGKIRRRGTNGRRASGAHSRSTPSTPDQPRAQISVSEERDSDSDTAAGFHSAWRQQSGSQS